MPCEVPLVLPSDEEKKRLKNVRPFSGVVLNYDQGSISESEDDLLRAERVDTSSLDVLIVLLRALAAHGWRFFTNASQKEKSIVEIALSDLRQDQKKISKLRLKL
jgi:hypothetical protein